MNYLHWDGELDSDIFDEFLKEFNQINQEDSTVFFFSSCGGDVNIAYMLASLFDNLKERLEIVVTFDCSSSAFIFLTIMNLKGAQISFAPTAFSCIHLAEIDIPSKEQKKDSDYYKFFTGRLDAINNELIEMYTAFPFTSEELNLIKKHEDLWVNAYRLNELFRC